MLKDKNKTHHQGTKNTTFHQEKQGINLVFLGVLVVRFFR